MLSDIPLARSFNAPVTVQLKWWGLQKVTSACSAGETGALGPSGMFPERG
ncbi:MAG: hypothetical protein HQ561_15560 [Desulfobacteraceae bacterium]|nr:hypothetical protein [Desulfobacteraceae bacterium]